MSNTYGDIDIPPVRTVSEGSDVADLSHDMTEHEYRLVTILIRLTFTREELVVNTNETARALECFGYDEYEALPMVWRTLEEIGKRCYD